MKKRPGLTHEKARDIAAWLFLAQFLAWLALSVIFPLHKHSLITWIMIAMVPITIDRLLITWGEEVIGDRPAAKIVAAFFPLTAAIFTAALAAPGGATHGA